MKMSLALAFKPRKCSVRARLADEAREQLADIADRRAAPQMRPRPRPLEDIDELHCLAALDHRLRRHQRHPGRPTFAIIVQIVACEIGSSPSSRARSA